MGKALAGGRRENVVLATKVHGTMGDDPNEFGNSRRWIVREVENSLRRLGTDWIDLYQIHRPEPDTDIDETLGALTDLVRAGKIRYFGCSTFPAEPIVRGALGRRAARARALRHRAAALLHAGPRDRARRAAHLRERYGMGVIPWSPLGGGWLSGRYRKDAEPPTSTRAAAPSPSASTCRSRATRPSSRRPKPSRCLAEEAGMTLIELAIAFVLAHPAVTAPIIGPRTMEQLESQLSAADVELSEDILDRIDEIVPPGTNLNPPDAGWVPPAVADKRLRRPLRLARRRQAPDEPGQLVGRRHGGEHERRDPRRRGTPRGARAARPGEPNRKISRMSSSGARSSASVRSPALHASTMGSMRSAHPRARKNSVYTGTVA